jgi:hypothetical protein
MAGRYELDLTQARCEKPVDTEIYDGLKPAKPWVDLNMKTGLNKDRMIKRMAVTSFLCEVCEVSAQCEQFGKGTGSTGFFAGEYVNLGEVAVDITARIRTEMEAF